MPLDLTAEEWRAAVRPHAGRQSDFLSSSADIAIFGGAAGGGKSYGLLLEPLRHVMDRRDFFTVYFRKTTVQVRAPGGLWDQSMKIYPQMGGIPRNQTLEWWWPDGGRIKLAHLDHENTKLDWQGSEVPLICCQEDEPIRLADGTLRPLRRVRVGDMVATLQGPRAVTAIGNRRRESCVQAIVRDQNGREIGRQVHSRSHEILAASGEWLSYLDMCAARSGFSISASRQSCASGISRARNRTMCQSAPRHRGNPSQGSEPIRECVRQRLDRSVWWGNDADTAPRSRGSDCVASGYADRTAAPPTAVVLSVMLHAPCRLSDQPRRGPAYTFAPGASACALVATEPEGSPDRCCPWRNLGDAHARPVADSGLALVPRPADAAAQSRTDWPSDGRGKARSDNPPGRRYVHPYTGASQTAAEDSVFATCEMIPCGDQWVIDLTIHETCHYITECGIVNKNCFDELTHFSETQFWYLLSRNRSLSGVKGYVRASTNPDSDSWVRRLIDWWIDSGTGLPIPGRRGVLRWFVRIDDMLQWADTPEELTGRYPGSVPKSLTFIGATLEDNPTLMRLDPSYRANLLALPMVERERLLGGNWNIRPSAGLYFNRSWIRVVDVAPQIVQTARGWDLAATPETPSNDPDWTTGTLIGSTVDGRYIVLHHNWLRGSPAEVERLLLNTASQDGYGCMVGLPQDPGQAGKAQIATLVRLLAGFPIDYSPETGDKITRFSPFSAQAEAGNVIVLRGDWNERWFHVLEGFPELPHDDDVDSTSRAFSLVAQGNLAQWMRL